MKTISLQIPCWLFGRIATLARLAGQTPERFVVSRMCAAARHRRERQPDPPQPAQEHRSPATRAENNKKVLRKKAPSHE